MNIQRLKYFCAVAQTEHISRAAEKLHIAQPALSKAISLLEEELGVSLFQRLGRQIRLNDNGREFLKYAQTAISAIDDGSRLLQRLNQVTPSCIRLQTNITHDSYLIGLMKSFRQDHPEVSFEVIKNYVRSKFLYDCDLYIHADNITLNKCESLPLFSENILLGVPADNPLAAQKHIHLAQAAAEPFISLDKTSSWIEETEALCAQAGFTPRYRYLCDGSEMVAKLIGAGEGIGFLPQKSWGEYSSDIALLTIDFPVCRRQYNMSWQPGRAKRDIVMAFKAHTYRYYHALERQGGADIVKESVGGQQ